MLVDANTSHCRNLSFRALQVVAVLTATAISAETATAQFFARCDSGRLSELVYSIRAHEEHSYRLNRKFLDEFYFQGELPDTFVSATLEDIQDYLRAQQPRSAALLFHSISDSATCSWLISADEVVADVIPATAADLDELGTDLLYAIGAAASERARSPRRRGVELSYAERAGSVDEQQVLDELSQALFPDKVRSAFLEAGHDTLLLAPVSSIATLPLAALPIDDSRSLADVASIMVIPGFFSLRTNPVTQRFAHGPALVVGDPVSSDDEWVFPPLPGARAEAIAIAEQVGADPLIGAEATLPAIASRIAAEPGLTLIYLATHGVASRTDPRDASFLMLTDGRWAAADIQNLDLASHPLVVLSACQTGLGKDFDVGTIGMARAWERAGASNIATSLWNVDDEAAKNLMMRFVARIDAMPADKALREAMLEMRDQNADVVQWASFTMFGLPETMSAAQDDRNPCCEKNVFD